MKALLAGGPAEGVIDTRKLTTKDGRWWTLTITHVNCACKWCEPIDANVVDHLYERGDDDVFRYRSSAAPEDA